MTMTEEEKEISDLKINMSILEQRVKFMEKIGYTFIGFVVLNLVALFFLWVYSLK